MPLIINGSNVGNIGMITEPTTYDADLVPEDMQLGSTAYVKGKKITGTGKAFEFALYGLSRVREVNDENGDKKYGFEIVVDNDTNLLFIIPSVGDSFMQDKIIVNLIDGEPVKIGINTSANGTWYAYKTDETVIIYSTKTQDKQSQFYYFIGKDKYLLA